MFQNARLDLYVSTTFWSRLRGLHGHTPLTAAQGLYLAPCKAVHTLGMCRPIDVVFIDQQFHELKRIDALPPNRFAGCSAAMAVIELPAGYCHRHSDYLVRIRAALVRAKAGNGAGTGI